MSAVGLRWHKAEGVTNKWVERTAIVIATWIACSSYYNIPELLHEHGRLESIVRNRNAIHAEQMRATAAEQANAQRIDALFKQIHDMENRNAPKVSHGREGRRPDPSRQN